MEVINFLEEAVMIVVLAYDRPGIWIDKSLNSITYWRKRAKVESLVRSEFEAVPFRCRAETLERVMRPDRLNLLQYNLERQPLESQGASLYLCLNTSHHPLP